MRIALDQVLQTVATMPVSRSSLSLRAAAAAELGLLGGTSVECFVLDQDFAAVPVEETPKLVLLLGKG